MVRARVRGVAAVAGRSTGRRVVLLVESAPPLPYWRDAAASLVQRGEHPILVTLQGRGPLHDLVTDVGGEAAWLGARSSKGYPRATWRLARLLRREAVDVVQAVGAIPAGVAGVAGVLAPRTRLLYHRHHLTRNEPVAFDWLGRTLTHATLAVSDVVADRERAEAHRRRQVLVAANGVPTPRPVPPDEVGALKATWRIPPSAAVVVVVARLRPEKGHEVLFRAVPRAAARCGRPIVVVVVGEGPHLAVLEAAARAVPDLDVRFVGNQDDVDPWYALADVVAVPSLEEPFGLVPIEAMASGRPVVASAVDGIIETTAAGAAAVLVPPGDVDALAEGLSRVLADRSVAEHHVRAGRERYLENYTVDRMVAGWVAAYDAVIGPSS